jgi:plastocyanin
MDNETLFYICGIGLAVSAVAISFVGLKAKNFPGKAFPVVILWFAILIGGATTFSVLHAKDEEHEKAAEFEKAGKEIEADQTTAPFETEGAQGGGEEEAEEEVEPAGGEEAAESKPSAGGPGGTLQLAADASAIAYDTTSLTSKPGKVTIDFDNPAPLEHDVAIEGDDGKEIAGSELIAEAKTSVSAELAPGTYTFFCTVPGHREAGMEGTLSVK